MSELAAQFDGDVVSDVIALTDVGVDVLGPIDFQAYDRFSAYTQNIVDTGGGTVIGVGYATAPTLDGPWVQASTPLTTNLEPDNTAVGTVVGRALKYVKVQARCSDGENTGAKFWLSAGGYDATAPITTDLADQFDGAYSGVVDVNATPAVVLGPLDVQAYRHFSVYVANDGGGSGNDILQAILQTGPTEDGPWTDVTPTEGDDDEMALAADAAAFILYSDRSLKYVRVRAACDAAEDTTGRFWFCAGGY